MASQGSKESGKKVKSYYILPVTGIVAVGQREGNEFKKRKHNHSLLNT